METLQSYVNDAWVTGTGDATKLLNPTTEEVVAQVAAEGIDVARAMSHAREVGGPALRAMTFRERGQMLKALSEAVIAQRDDLLNLSMINNGATRSDAKFDVDGASFTLAAYAELGEALGDARYIVDGEPVELLRSRKLGGLHLKTPYRGVALHINAFNFPAWGLAEKAAVAWLAGMPVVSKPATATSWVAEYLARGLVESGALPPGAFSFIAGHPSGLVDSLDTGDVLAFTGSSGVGNHLRTHANVIAKGVPVNIEADSVNSVVLGPDIEAGDDVFDMLVRDVLRETIQKTGQKCTATRRVFIPAPIVEDFTEALVSDLSRIPIGDPFTEGVRMGPVVSGRQRDDILAGLERFAGATSIVRGSGRPSELAGVEGDRGFFVDAHVLRTADPAASLAADVVHDEEIFGPVTTVLPYDGTVEQAAALVARGRGSLVASVYSDDRDFSRDLVLDLAPWSGRVTLGSAKIAASAPSPGVVLPQLVHGGPGRAGGGEELGAERGLDFYLQRTAVQGYRPLVERLFDGR
jgi:oxepin-CoA hydrolase/3-oxo-5,6-dehydrosuberyl-CoA semialdehyde dehydrogenase